MLKFNKLFTYKIISVIVIITFTVTNICYGIDLPKKSHLRAPLLGNTKEGIERLNKALSYELRSLLNYEVKAETKQRIINIVMENSGLSLLALTAVLGFGVNLPFALLIILSGPVIIVLLIAVILYFSATLPYSKADNDKLISDAWDIVEELKKEYANDPEFQGALLLIKRFVVSPKLPQVGHSYNYIVKDAPVSDEELVKEYVHHLPTGTLVISPGLMRNRALAKYVIAHRAIHFMYERLGSDLRSTEESFVYNNVEPRIRTFIIDRANSITSALNYELIYRAIITGALYGMVSVYIELPFIWGIIFPLLNLVAIKGELFINLGLLWITIIYFWLTFLNKGLFRGTNITKEFHKAFAKTNEQVVNGVQELLQQGQLNWDKIRHQYYLHPDDLEILITLLKDKGFDVKYESESGNLVLIEYQIGNQAGTYKNLIEAATNI